MYAFFPQCVKACHTPGRRRQALRQFCTSGTLSARGQAHTADTSRIECAAPQTHTAEHKNKGDPCLCEKTCSDRGMAQATGSVHGTPCKSLPLLSSTYTCPLVPPSSGGYAPRHASHLSSTATLAATLFLFFFPSPCPRCVPKGHKAGPRHWV